MWTQPAPCFQQHFITIIILLLIWPFRLRCLLNILPWTKCLLLGCYVVVQIFPLWSFFLLLHPLFTLMWSLIVPPPLCFLSSPPPEMTSLFFSPPAPHLLYVRFPYPLHLFSFLASLSISVPVSYRIFFMGSQWREDGGPGFGHWCGRARWLCQYPWPAGNSSGSTTSQSGAPSWEEVPDNVWERLLCVREWSANERTRRTWYRRKTRDDFRIELEESSFVLQCFRWVTALKCIVPRTCTRNSTRARH